LIGSYVVDFIAMIFGMPTALFPAISEHFGGVKVVGLLYAAPATGAMVAMFFSAWTKNIHRSGLAIALSALCWGIGITAFGFSSHLGLALFFLMVAGAGDAMSGVFRMTLWNQTIPDRLRGRLAGLEMISYMSGPLLGNAESGLVAAAFSTGFSVISGGIFCIAGVGLSVLFLPKFLSYRLPQAKSELI
jgi:MFS family permease